MTTRSTLRRTTLERRDALSADDRASYSAKIIGHLWTLLETLNVRFIHCYISFRSEVETRGFINQALERGLRVVVPVVEELDGSSFLVHTEIQHLNNLQRGRFGLEEPVERSPAALDGLGAVILPVAAFDDRGNRLGYGKGFYDRFLNDVPPHVTRIGLAFDLQRADEVPIEAHDKPLDVVITESGVVNAARNREGSSR